MAKHHDPKQLEALFQLIFQVHRRKSEQKLKQGRNLGAGIYSSHEGVLLVGLLHLACSAYFLKHPRTQHRAGTTHSWQGPSAGIIIQENVLHICLEATKWRFCFKPGSSLQITLTCDKLTKTNKNRTKIEGRGLSGVGYSYKRKIKQQSNTVERVSTPETSEKGSLPNDDQKARQGSPYQPPNAG